MPHSPKVELIALKEEAIVRLDLGWNLKLVSFLVVASLATNAEALEKLAEDSPNVAILDLSLLDRSCEPFAHAVANQSIPFIVNLSIGWSDRRGDKSFAVGGWLQKPSKPLDLKRLINATLGDRIMYPESGAAVGPVNPPPTRFFGIEDAGNASSIIQYRRG